MLSKTQQMKLNIDKDQAIKILGDRLKELEHADFNSKAWKDRTENDLREIFPLGSMQWLQISSVRFDTFITAEKEKVFNEAKVTAKKLVSSFIDFINDYSKVAEEKKVISEKDYQQKYLDLLKDWNDLVPGYNELIKNYDSQLITNENLLDTIDTKEQELQNIKSETIQLDNVSLNKFLKVFSNLPLIQITAIVAVFIAIIGTSFTLGKLYQENVDNNKLFEYQTENQNLKKDKETLEKDKGSLQKKLLEKQQKPPLKPEIKTEQTLLPKAVKPYR